MSETEHLPDTVLIAGAGIGGLTAALSLHQAGLRAIVVDSVTELRPIGVGINLLPHAVRELTELGLGEELSDPPRHRRTLHEHIHYELWAR
jgi:2-polyprenyl-6-methoxyphenol hydroxylase-like FAD-dependent oxidoreductase